MVDVFIIGSKGIPAKYGGFETFVDQLTKEKKSDAIKYHVSCLANNDQEFDYQGVRCFNVKVPSLGSARAIIYDIMSMRRCIEYIRKNHLKKSIVYVLACRIGPTIAHYRRILHKLGAKIFLNPDGHEWLRSKWSKPVQIYWKISERLMIKNADLIICDSKGIEKYVIKCYSKYNPKTTFVAYGSETSRSPLKSDDPNFVSWLDKNKLKPKQYYLIVGRFVPENNYELMIKEFMASDSKKSLVIISNVNENKFYNRLINETHFKEDSRIKFVGTVYDRPLLQKIREEAYGYLHGHEVGGTNPSLLEALTSTQINLLLDVVFNKEVGADGALYFNKKRGDLARLINHADTLSAEVIERLDQYSSERIRKYYSWALIVNKYELLFTK
ncbi:beta 1-4 rhamnosyltransferase Cps2T [Sporolactobacillus terrae]|uniref:beta 1-4 rhamnosyltransferase Cps2T n=1 Tax=Sporolactobacillus terrae TaxID=269673 RepID=UPI00048FBC7D|nr:DUF1972 domain-containing protein [Sporolactobacillus terrae]